MFDFLSVTDVARSLHLAGMAMGLGLAICADWLVFTKLFRPITLADVDKLRWMHRAIQIGLAVLWASGLTILWLRTGFDVDQFTPKLMVKLFVVTILTVNALAIGGAALSSIDSMVGQRLGAMDLRTRFFASIIMGVSVFCWMSALALGVFTRLRDMDFAGFQQMWPIGIGMLVLPIAVGLSARVLGNACASEDSAYSPERC